jgi:transcriptional regulator with XRE-family HTH domain
LASPQGVNMQDVGERVMLLRRRQGLTLRELAQRIGTSYATISRLETGKKPQMTFALMARLAQALQTSLDYLAFGASPSGHREHATPREDEA